MRGIASDPELIARRLRERRERIRLVRSACGIVRGDGRRVRFVDTLAFIYTDAIFHVYLVSRETEDAETGLPRYVLVSLDHGEVRDATAEEVYDILHGMACRCLMD